MVLSDCLLAIKFVLKQAIPWSDVEAQVEEIWHLSKHFNVCNFLHVPREENKSADYLAKEARRFELNDVWINNLPEWIESMVVFDLVNYAPVAC